MVFIYLDENLILKLFILLVFYLYSFFILMILFFLFWIGLVDIFFVRGNEFVWKCVFSNILMV